MIIFPNSRPELKPASFYEACQRALLGSPWDQRRDARNWYGNVRILSATSGLSEDAEGEIRLHDYYMWESADWDQEASDEVLVPLEQRLLELGHLALALDLSLPKPQGSNLELPIGYFALLPSAISRDSPTTGTLLYGDGVSVLEPLVPEGRRDVYAIVETKSVYAEGMLTGFTSRLIEEPSQDPQLVLIYDALCHQGGV